MPAQTRQQTSKSLKSSYGDSQRTVGQQTVHNDRTYVSPQVLATKNHEFQEYSPAFYKPHTLTMLVILLLILLGLSQSSFLQNLTTPVGNVEDLVDSKTQENKDENAALIGVCFAFICIGCIHLPNSIMSRPHVIFWRALLAVFILYAMFITYLLLLPVDKARATLRIFDDKLGVRLPEHNYGEDCRLFTPEHPTNSMANFTDAVFDCHFVAHFLGWWGKMMIMRDWYVAWACSISFEICEITFRHWLPNFYECWWDHLFLDLFGCNLIGIILGHFTLKYFAARKLTWVWDPKSEKKSSEGHDVSCSNSLQVFLDKLRPTVFEQYEWAGLANLQRFYGVTFFVLFVLIIDCNNFFLKFVLWLPPDHDTLKFRVVMWGLCSLATAKEWFEYISNEYCHRLGPFAWLTMYTCGVETMTVIKCSDGQFTAAFPWYVKVMWVLISLSFLWLSSIAYRNSQREVQSPNKGVKEYNPYNPDLDIVNHGKKSN